MGQGEGETNYIEQTRSNDEILGVVLFMEKNETAQALGRQESADKLIYKRT